jgi:DNA-directed RNA polymerase specialized sigma subunit
MFQTYRKALPQFSKLSLEEERRLIALAKRGSEKHAKEIVLRHISFVIFRLQRVTFPGYLKRFGDDLLSESTLILYQKIKTYNLRYKDKQGNPKPVKFSSYIWKRIDGHILDSLKKETQKDKLEEVLN